MTLLSLFKNTNSLNKQTLLFGKDEFLNDYLVQSMIREDEFAEYDHVVVNCETDGLNELISNMTESSLFSKRKLLIIKRPFFLTAKATKKAKKQLEQLERIFVKVEQLDDVIVLVASYDKLDRRKKLTKTILAQFNLVETNIKTYKIGTVIKSLIKMEGYEISASALQLLLERSDHELDTILSNYNKLKMVAADRTITEHSVKQNIDLSLTQNVFSILEAALQHNYQESLIRLDNQLREGSSSIQLLAVFTNQIELMLVVKILAKRGRSENQIVKELGVHPYRVKLTLKKHVTIEKLKQLLQELVTLDYNYKNGTYQTNNFLRMFVLSI